jgi:N-acetyl-gamma-glutamyl-phosphate reductase
VIGVAVVGAAGYSGIEAVRWVLAHPRFELTRATSAADAGKRLDAVYPALRGLTELSFSAPDTADIAAHAEIALLAVPHTAAMAMAPGLMERGVKVIDLSADFRLSDVNVYEAWYGVAHSAPELLGEAVYGLPEVFNRASFEGASLVACPGCYPTATILAAAPALEAGVAIGTRVIVDAKSGVSGAGRSASAATHYCTVNEALVAYKVGSHRHTPEMEQALTTAAGRPVLVSFTPHLVPMTRGLLSTVYLEVGEGFTTADAFELYSKRYDAEPFVGVCDPGVMPSTSDVRGTNRASLGVHVDERTRTLTVSSAIDNLGKGSAGQAIQCANAVVGLPETTGLLHPTGVV